MEDTHFLERLERVSGREVEMALGLYRDPGLVRFVLHEVGAPEAERVAISLDCPREGPFVLVQRDGHFVTCLGRGMHVGDLPVVTREQLERLGRRHEAWRERIEYWQAVNQDCGFRRLFGAVLLRGHRVSRETIAALVPVAPILAPLIDEGRATNGKWLLTFLASQEPERLLRRSGRWSALDATRAERLWSSVWSYAHLTLLAATQDHHTLAQRTSRVEEACADVLALERVGFNVPFWPLQLRLAWATARHGKLVLPWLKRELAACADLVPDGCSVALALAFVGMAHPKLRAEVQKALAVGAGQGADSVSLWRNLMADVVGRTPERDQATLVARIEQFARGSELLELPLPPARDVIAQGHLETPDGRRRIWKGQGWYGNLFVDPFFLEDRRLFRRIGMQLWGLAIADPEELYPTEADLDADEGPWVPVYSEELLAAICQGDQVFRTLRPEPVRKGPTVGRNEPCPCGSGKKHKKCCLG